MFSFPHGGQRFFPVMGQLYVSKSRKSSKDVLDDLFRPIAAYGFSKTLHIPGPLDFKMALQISISADLKIGIM